MSGNDSSCPRCGFQEMRDISFWKNENHICAECGAYWKTINNARNSERSSMFVDIATKENKSNFRLNFGKKKLTETEFIDRQKSINGKKPSAVTGDFFDKIQDSSIGYVSNRRMKKSQFRKQFLPELNFVNVATFSVVAITLVSLPQIGLFSVARQTIQEQVAFLRGDFEEIPQIDPIVTASISKTPKIAEAFRVGKVKFTRIAKGAQSHIVVHGMIRNISGHDARTRPLRIVMVDKNGKEVQSWIYMVRDTVLEPGQIIRFRSTVKAVGYKAKTVKAVILN